MRLRAPEGKGHPVLRGVEVKPEDDGTYVVSHEDGQLFVKTHGYIDADAPVEKPKANGDGSAVRSAALAHLEAFGVKLVDASDDLIARALGDLRETVNGQMADAVKRAETDTDTKVRAELADKSDGKKK